MDINEEAVRVAAFSLYLAFPHYQEPREINAERRLPYLKWVSEEERNRREKQKPGGQFFDVLLHANAFEAISGECPSEVTRRFGPGTATVVVGNPPWGYPKKEDKDGQKALAKTLKWCDPKKGRPVGNKELSQAFIHLTLSLLNDGGRAGLLVSSGILFKHHRNSRDFRRVWLASSRLEHIVNFAHVRQIFFTGPQREAKGISPFLSVVFERTTAGPPLDSTFQYWSAKRTASIENTKCVVLNRGDMHWLSQRDCLADERLWKIYWWGGHRDHALIRRLCANPPLIQLPEHLSGVTLRRGRGFEVTTTGSQSDWLKDYRELPSDKFVRYGKLTLGDLRDVPNRVYRKGCRDIYSGHRLLVARGIRSGGIITARLETRKYCFRNSIHGVRFNGLESWQEAVITAIFWSSLARYFYFTTSGSWGFWHDEIHLEDVEQLPVRFPSDSALRDHIVGIVRELQQTDFSPVEQNLFQHAESDEPLGSAARLRELERELDDAIFDVYGLSSPERDVIRETCGLGLDLFYKYHKGEALQEVVLPARNGGTFADLLGNDHGLSAYLRTFLEVWNPELAPDGEFGWQVLSPPSRAPLLAVSFTTRYKREQPPTDSSQRGAEEWSEILATLQKYSLIHGGSSRIFIDTFFRHVGDRHILFIKRNERRFWTRTAAREDAESALTHLMNLDSATPGDAI